MNIPFAETIDGFHFTGLADFEPAEPGWPAIVTVFILHVDGSHKDFIDIINPAIVQRIEKLQLEDL